MKRTFSISLLTVAVGTGIGLYFLQRDTQDEAPLAVEELVSEELATQEALIEQVRREPEAIEQIAEPMAEERPPLVTEATAPPALYARETAPDLNPAQLSPELSRTYNNYAPLRTEAFRNPDSEYNRSTVADLEATRKERTQSK